MKTNLFSLLKTIILLSVLLLSGCSSKSVSNISTSEMIPSSSPPLPTVSSSQYHIDTKDWRTISVDYWQFKVPPDWHYIRCKKGAIFIGPDINKDVNQECSDGPHSNFIYLTRQSRKQLPEIPYFDDPDAVKKNIKVGNLNAIELALYFKGKIVEGPVTYVKHEDSIDTIHLFDKMYESIFSEILATFKFTN